MPSTTLTDQQHAICMTYLAVFREGDRSTKLSVVKEAAKEILLSMPDVDKRKKKEMRMVSDFDHSKS
jgi:hypothetical protein